MARIVRNGLQYRAPETTDAPFNDSVVQYSKRPRLKEDIVTNYALKRTHLPPQNSVYGAAGIPVGRQLQILEGGMYSPNQTQLNNSYLGNGNIVSGGTALSALQISQGQPGSINALGSTST